MSFEGYELDFEVSDGQTKNINSLHVGDEFEGMPEVDIFINDGVNENTGKEYNYDSVRVRVGGVTAYANIPKIDGDGYITEPIKKSSNFHKNAFNLIMSVLVKIDPNNKFADSGNPVEVINKINIYQIQDLLNSADEVTLKITDGSNGYNSFIIL